MWSTSLETITVYRQILEAHNFRGLAATMKIKLHAKYFQNTVYWYVVPLINVFNTAAMHGALTDEMPKYMSSEIYGQIPCLFTPGASQ